MIAHGRTMKGSIQRACLGSLGLQALSKEGLKKILYDINKAKSATDMIAKMKRIRFMKDGTKFVLSTAKMSEFYDQLILFNNRFIKLLQCYSLRADESSLPTLFKRNNVMGVWDFYLDALPDKSGRVFWEELVSLKPAVRNCTTLDDVVEQFRKHIEKKRTLAQRFKDLGKSLKVRVDSASSQSSSGNEDAYTGSGSEFVDYDSDCADGVVYDSDEAGEHDSEEQQQSSDAEVEDQDSAAEEEYTRDDVDEQRQEDPEQDMDAVDLESPGAWSDTGDGDY